MVLLTVPPVPLCHQLSMMSRLLYQVTMACLVCQSERKSQVLRWHGPALCIHLQMSVRLAIMCCAVAELGASRTGRLQQVVPKAFMLWDSKVVT